MADYNKAGQSRQVSNLFPQFSMVCRNLCERLYSKLFLVIVIMKVVRNTAVDVRFTFTTMVCSVFVVVWH